jgi:5-methylcytosine-specific restriction endonuclease McrA
MAYKKFFNDEEGFDDWVKFHSFGLVINSSPGKLDPNYVKAHRPTCQSIQRHVGATTVYSKHCFDSVSEALDYLKSNGIPKPTFGCSACKVSSLEPTTDAHQLQVSVASLIAKGFTSAPVGNRTPPRVTVASTTLVQRDPAVVTWVQTKANGKCELCSAAAPFQTNDGQPYLEVHHVKTLASGGPDTIDNTVALCPNCHRAMHYSKSKAALLTEIYNRVSRLVR